MAINDNEAATIKFAVVNLSATGDLVTAVSGKKIRVLGYVLSGNGTVSANFESDTTDISGLLKLAANTTVSYAGGWDAPAFETASGEKLALTLSGSVDVDGHVTYVLVDA